MTSRTHDNKSNRLKAVLVRGASGTLALKIGNTVMSMVLAVVLARLLGVDDFGRYSFCMSVVNILTIPAMLGGREFLVREVAAYQVSSDFGLLRGLLSTFRRASLVVSLLLAASAAGIGYHFFRAAPLEVPFLVAMTIIPFHTAMQLQGAALRGFRQIVLGQLPVAIRPALVALIFAGVYWTSNQEIEPEAALAAQLVANALLVGLTILLLQKAAPEEVKSSQPKFARARWITDALPFLLAGGMQILNTEASIVLLGVIGTEDEVGLFRVAQRAALLIVFGLYAVNMTLGPRASEMFTSGETQRLQRIVRKSLFAVLSFGIPVAAVLILGGGWLIPAVFGAGYAPAYAPLVVLSIGQLIAAATGSNVVLLNMAGHQRLTASAVAISGISNVLLNLTLIPILGTVGAAVASSSSLVLQNLILCIALYKKTGLISTIWPKLS
jgi:O-antigen/teichoic acid export membrane protein